MSREGVASATFLELGFWVIDALRHLPLKALALFLLSLLLVACGPSEDEINTTAIITCNVMGESRNMDAAMRIKEINAAREKIGADPYLGNDDGIKESFQWGLCEELVKGDETYRLKLATLQREVARAELIAAEEDAVAREKEKRQMAEELESVALKVMKDEAECPLPTELHGRLVRFAGTTGNVSLARKLNDCF